MREVCPPSATIRSKALNLPKTLSDGIVLGSNLSAGQRQLVSLARALLTPTNILGQFETEGPKHDERID